MTKRVRSKSTQALLTPDQVKRMFELAESQNQRDYLLLLTMALTGFSRGEITGLEHPRRSWTLPRYLKTETQSKAREREENFHQLMEGKVPEIERGRTVIRLSSNRKYVMEIALDPSLPGLRIEDFKGDSILVTEKFGNPRTVKLEPFLSQKLSKFIGERKEGRIFPISDTYLYYIVRKYGKAALIPFPVNPSLFEVFYEKYEIIGIPALLGLSPFTPEFVEARTKEENEEVEWKVRVADPLEFCETMVAFANRTGGIILVGVDDDGAIQGLPHVDLAEIEGKLTNYNHEFCDPRVFFKVAEVKVYGKIVVVVEVREGVDKPYWLKNKGFVIRSGSSDRIMTRTQVVSEILRGYRLPRGNVN